MGVHVRRLVFCTILVLVFLPVGSVLGQGTNASLSGTVLDPSKAIIPGATVTALNVNTGVAVTTVSNDSGVYMFQSLQPGTYRISVEQPGFKKLVYDDLKLEVAARISLNLPMELGVQAETVEVKAALETALGLVSASIGGMLTAQM
jgi:hypothetical protein